MFKGATVAGPYIPFRVSRIFSMYGLRYQESDDQETWRYVPRDGRLSKRFIRVASPPDFIRMAEMGLFDG